VTIALHAIMGWSVEKTADERLIDRLIASGARRR